MHKIKLIILIGLFLLFPFSSYADHDYPLTLTVLRAKRFINHFAYGGASETTEIVGTLSDEPQKQIHMSCDVGMFALDADGKPGARYAARHGKHNEIKISAREQGSNKIHEHTCKM